MTVDQERLERRPEGLAADHFTVRGRAGALTLHARPECSGLTAAAIVTPDIVDILWECNPVKVRWCMNCAVRRKRS